MTHPDPPGTRDVLPDEMRELRALTERLRSAFEPPATVRVWTPSLEYEEVLKTGDERAAGAATGSSTSTARCWRCAPT